jgi:ubiquinone/menaquinone biosynthesis C-methylase UbiE
MAENKQLEHVRDFFDYDSIKYRTQRYPVEPRTCDQFSYLARKAYVLEMLDQDGPKEKGKILDIGCGPGIYAKDLLERGWEVWGIDLSPKMIEVAAQSISDVPEPDRQRAHFSVGQVDALTFDAEFFDAVICIGVLSYVESLENSLSEISRVLKPGGRAVLQLSNKISPFEFEVSLKRWIKNILGIDRNLGEEDRLEERVRCTPYIPARFRQVCRQMGFILRDHRYYDFRLPVLNRFSPGTALAVGKRMESFGRSSSIGWLGACYIVKLEKR